jgi:kinesin family protein 22
VKPLVSAAFEGINSTVIAHGARGSGKTQLLQVWKLDQFN